MKKDYVINEKMLSAIFDVTVSKVKGCTEGGIWYIVGDDPFTSFIDINKLYFRVKEYIEKQNYQLMTDVNGTAAIWSYENAGVWNVTPDHEIYVKNNEIQAVFNMLEWIMNDMKNKGK